MSKQSILCHCGLSEERQYTCFALTFITYYICLCRFFGAIKYTTYIVLLRNLVRCGPSDVRFYMECKNVFYCGPSVGRSYTVCLLFLLLYDLHYGGGNSFPWLAVIYIVVRWWGNSFFRSHLRMLTAIFSLAVEEWWLIAVQIWVAVGRVCMYHGDGCFKRLAMLQVGANQWSFILFLFVHSCNLQFAYSYGLCRRFHVYFGVLCNRFFEQFGRMGPSWFITSVCLGYYFLYYFYFYFVTGSYPYRLCREALWV